MKLFFKTYWIYFVSFIIPIIIMIGVYLSQGIYWNSDNSPVELEVKDVKTKEI